MSHKVPTASLTAKHSPVIRHAWGCWLPHSDMQQLEGRVTLPAG